MTDGYEKTCDNCGRAMPEDEYSENNGVCVICGYSKINNFNEKVSEVKMEEEKTFKAFITKYALTKGILEITASYSLTGSDMIHDTDLQGVYYHGEGRQWHKTRAEAVKHANEMRLKKITTLQKQLVRLREMKF